MSASTINKEVATLKRVFNLAEQRGYLPEGTNPFAGIKKRKVSERPRRYVSGEEIRNMIERAPSLRWRAMLSLLYTTGLRLAEACHLTWDDVYFEAGMVRVAPKRDAGTRIPWEPKDHELRHIRSGSGWPGCSASSRPGSRRTCPTLPHRERYAHVMEKLREGRWEEGRQLINNVLRDFRVIAKRAGVKPCTVHDLRRSCLTNWAREVPAHVLQKLAGHSSMETTLKYLPHRRPQRSGACAPGR